MNIDKIKRAAFDSFKGEKPNFWDDDTISNNRFDPDYADAPTGATTQVNVARPNKKMQINLVLNNPSNAKLVFELFNAYMSCTVAQNLNLVQGNYQFIPQNSADAINAAIGAGQLVNTVGFDKAGNLNIRGNAGDPIATVGCNEYPYNSLLETTKVLGFKVGTTRVSVATQAQFDNNITFTKRTYAGVDFKNPINVRQNRRLINPVLLDIDVTASFTITGETGLQYALNAGESVQLGLYIVAWAKPTI